MHIKMHVIFGLLCLCPIAISLKTSSTTKTSEAHFHPDVGLNISQLLERHGYPFEEYTVQTKDGYLLGLHRIPHGLNNDSLNEEKPVALLVHGLMSQSIDWLNNEPDNSLGLILADKGYDVWLLNTRGNTYSRRHIKLNPDVDKKKFWDFSWHESGIYDLPATIDFILNYTKQEDLYYFGHSRGTTCFFVLTSMFPEYNAKIRLMTALAPIAFMGNNCRADIREFAPLLPELEVFFDLLDIHEIMAHSDKILELVKTCCYEGSLCLGECEAYFNYSFGYSPDEFNLTLLPVHLSNSPSGNSVKDAVHYIQLYKSGDFSLYDYGKKENLRRYGQSVPPQYNISNVQVPVALHFSFDDESGNYTDAQHLASILPNCVRSRMVPGNYFRHLDFIWGRQVNRLVYDVILGDIEKKTILP